MKKPIHALLASVLAALLLSACSLPPLQPVTRVELMKTRIYNRYLIDESPEELLYALNTRGEIIVEGKRNIPGRDFPVYVKLLATSEGVHVNEYDR
ncbi:MAG: hypothetical protein OEL80_03950 [Desulfuromonadales bacterium]|jgi:hypothetical protein|nr:hypothetical protein [Desulfuromonadales bacterium]